MSNIWNHSESKAIKKYPPPPLQKKKKNKGVTPLLYVKGRGFFASLNFDQKLDIEFYQVLELVNLLSLDSWEEKFRSEIE